jgi:hypothetical protein
MRRPPPLAVRSAACLAAALLLAPAARGQAVPPGSFGESVEVDLMTVEVLAVDAQGNVVRDLGRDEFRLFENGRRVEVTHFEQPPAASVQPSKSLPITPVFFVCPSLYKRMIMFWTWNRV